MPHSSITRFRYEIFFHVMRKNINSRQSGLVDQYLSIPISVFQFESTYLVISLHHGFYRRSIQTAFWADKRLHLCLWYPIRHHGLAITSTSGRRDAKRGGLPDDQRWFGPGWSANLEVSMLFNYPKTVLTYGYSLASFVTTYMVFQLLVFQLTDTNTIIGRWSPQTPRRIIK